MAEVALACRHRGTPSYLPSNFHRGCDARLATPQALPDVCLTEAAVRVTATMPLALVSLLQIEDLRNLTRASEVLSVPVLSASTTKIENQLLLAPAAPCARPRENHHVNRTATSALNTASRSPFAQAARGAAPR